MNRLAALALICLAACTPEDPSQSLTAEALAEEWRLVSLNGSVFTAQATLDLRDPEQASGQAPCNRWFAARGGVLPALTFGPVGATRMACPDLQAETTYLTALSQVAAVALADGNLVLTGADGMRMEFAPTP